MVAAGGLAALILWIRSKTGCQLLIHVRDDRIHKELDCRIRDGRVIVIARDGVRVDIIDTPPLLDFNGIVKAALSEGGDAVATAAQLAGATVQTTGR